MTALVRVATRDDVPGMHRVRLAVRENRLTSAAITEDDYPPEIEQTGRGWVAVQDGRVHGFAIGNRTTGNIWALFVDPKAEGKGLGRQLHNAMVRWLFSEGLQVLRLSTDPGTRAQRFYERAGWKFVRVLEDGEDMYELRSPNAA